VDLGDVEGDDSCVPLGISPFERFVTGVAFQANGDLPFLWTQGIINALPTLDVLPMGEGFAANSNGDVAGRWFPSTSAIWPSRAFLRRLNDAPIDIHAKYFGDSVASVAYDLNDNGDVVGIRSELTPQLPQSAWVLSGNKLTNLTAINAQVVEAWGINNSGLVVGRLSTSQVFTYQLGGAFTLLPLKVETREIFINEYGQLAGNANDGTAFLYLEGATWAFDTSTTGYLEIADFNDVGQIVANASQPFISEPLGPSAKKAPPLHALNPLITTPDWVMTKAHGIDDDGYVVGVARFNGGNERGVLLAPENLAKIFYQAAFAEILFGIINDGPGLALPGGHGPPVPGPPGPIWDVLTGGQRDAVLGLALNAGASLVSEASTRAQLERISAQLVRSASERLSGTQRAQARGAGAAAGRSSSVGTPRSRSAAMAEIRRLMAGARE
jgi:uncharacterized membrane protein